MEGTDFKTSKAMKEISQTKNLNEREKHLIGLAVTLTRGCTTCTSRRFEEALKIGISQQTLIDLSDLVGIVNAGVVLRTAITSSDMANLDEVCQDEVCKP